jgi:hypothetical protein
MLSGGAGLAQVDRVEARARWSSESVLRENVEVRGYRESELTNMADLGELTPAGLGGTYVRWGIRLFIFGLVIGYGPWLHYMLTATR